MRGKPVHYNNASLGAKMQDHNLANQINQHTLGMAKGLNSFPTTVPLLGYAKGGIIEGPGTGTSDSIPAKLPIESAIIPAHIVEMYGKDYFDKLEAAAPKTGKDKGEVNAKVSDGEYQLSADAVAHWGQDFITKLIASDKETPAENAMPGEEMAEMMPQQYAEGGIVEDPLPSLRDRAMNTAGSNAEFRQRNPDFGAKLAQSNAPQSQLGLRERLGMPVNQPQAQAPLGLRDRLGMAPRTEPIQRAPSLAPMQSSAPVVGGIRGALSNVMQNMGGAPALATGLASTVLNDPTVAEGRDNAILGLKQKAGIPENDTPYNFAEGGIVKPGQPPAQPEPTLFQKMFGTGTGPTPLGVLHGALSGKPPEQKPKGYAQGGIVEEEYDDAGIPVLDNIASKVKGLGQGAIDTVAAPFKALRNASNVDPNAMRIQPRKDVVANAPAQNSLAQPNPAPQSVLAPAVNQPQGLAGTATTGNTAPNPTLAPQNKYDFAQIPSGNRLQLTPEYNAQLNAQDTRTIAERDATNATPEQIAGVQPGTLALGGLGAYGRSSDNGGAFPVMNKAEQDAYFKNQSDAQRLRALAEAGQIRDPYTKQYLGQQDNLLENNYGAQNQLASAELAQARELANQGYALKRDELAQAKELATLGARQTKYQAVRNPDDNTVQMIPESGPGADAEFTQRQQEARRTQNSLAILNDPSATSEHLAAARLWLAQKGIAQPKQ